MEYTGEGIEAFVAVLEDMRTANLIFADKKAKEVLKCLAYYDEFRTVLSYCAEGFDYASEKKKVFSTGGGRDVLRLSRNPLVLVPTVVNMLVEFDSGGMDIVAFASKFFPADSKQESYDKFFNSVMEPFKTALVSLVVEGAPDNEKEERQVEFAPEGLQPQTEYLLVSMVNSVRALGVSEEERADLLVMLEGLGAALDLRDTLLIKAVWLGVKKVLLHYGICKNETEKMAELLKLYLVLK